MSIPKSSSLARPSLHGSFFQHLKDTKREKALAMALRIMLNPERIDPETTLPYWFHAISLSNSETLSSILTKIRGNTLLQDFTHIVEGKKVNALEYALLLHNFKAAEILQQKAQELNQCFDLQRALYLFVKGYEEVKTEQENIANSEDLPFLQEELVKITLTITWLSEKVLGKS